MFVSGWIAGWVVFTFGFVRIALIVAAAIISARVVMRRFRISEKEGLMDARPG